MKPVTKMSDAELQREVTALRDEERATRKARKVFAADKYARLTDIAFEQGNRWAAAQGFEAPRMGKE